MTNLTVNLERGAKTPLYEQLYGFIAAEIRRGGLSEGEKLPSKKSLAAHLAVSGNTVETAYSMLTQEGYIAPRPRSGFYVCAVAAGFAAPPQPQNEEPEPESWRFDFSTGAVDVASFPYRTWARLQGETMRNGEALLSSGDPRGDGELREAVAKYLREFRAVRCSAGQIVVGAGMEYLLMLLGELFSKSAFAVEEPGYAKGAAVLKNCGRTLRHIPLDRDGVRPDLLRRSGADVALITPSHQFPTGVIMPVGRRAELLNWASESPGRYIIEDDYNSELNFLGKPIPAMQGADGRRVIYMSTFSRVLAPSIRMACMVLPEALLPEFKERFGRYSSTVSRFEQQTMLRFMAEGHLGRHMNRVKTVYRRRREALSDALRDFAPPGAKISAGSAGLHFLVTLPPETADAVCRRALERGVRLHRLSEYSAVGVGTETLLLGCAGMEPARLRQGIEALFAN